MSSVSNPNSQSASNLSCRAFMLMIRSLKHRFGTLQTNEVCLDGSPPEYHFDRGSSMGINNWLIQIEHDVQELNRLLCEKLEDKMKGTVVEGTIQQLFDGHHMNYIECINVDYKCTRKESFFDLQLDVKGYWDVYASFNKYVEVERLEGDNKYNAKQPGLQREKQNGGTLNKKDSHDSNEDEISFDCSSVEDLPRTLSYRTPLITQGIGRLFRCLCISAYEVDDDEDIVYRNK